MAKRKRTLRDQIEIAMTGTAPSEDSSPEEQAAAALTKWTLAIQTAERFVDKWHKQADKAYERYLDDRKDEPTAPLRAHRLNLFHANITTLTSQLYARLPKVEADRRFYDPDDDVARVASEIVTRVLQNDMNDPDDTLDQVLRASLHDRLLAGFGGARVRYCIEEKPGDVMGEDGKPVPVKSNEWCDIVHVHPRDVLWSPCRTPAEVTWKAYRSYLTKEEVESRFGADIATTINYSSNGPKLSDEKQIQEANEKQAEVWEIWDKASKCVYWYSKGFPRFLDKKDDPLGLEGFFPDARPMVSNLTTRKYLPKPDFEIARDLYTEIDVLETRISLLTAACKAVGVYDAASKDVQRMLTDGTENQLIPVDKWALFSEKGGIRGVVDWMPITDIVNAVQVLTQQQQIRIQQLYQVTGMSDIMRGQASAPGTTATEQKIKAQFGSTRIQALQDEFALFAADLLNKKVQIIQRLYDPERIVKLSNILNTPDKDFVQSALALIKDPDSFNCRIVVRPETMAQIDYDQIKQERAEYLQATAQYLGQAQGLVQMVPESLPYLLRLMKFGLAGMKAGNEVEGVIDQFVSAAEKKLAEQAAQPPRPSPEEIKAQTEMAKIDKEAQVEAQAKQADFQLEQQRLAAEMWQSQQEFALEVRKMRLEIQQMQEKHALEMQKLQAGIQAQREAAQIRNESAVVQAAIAKDAAEDKAEGDDGAED